MEINITNPLDLVKLKSLMELTSGIPEIIVGLIDGPVTMNHPDLAGGNVLEVQCKSGACALTSSAACMHGTFVAGILSAKRNSKAPAICPNCTLLVRPIFPETAQGNGQMPSAKPEELAAAIIECVDTGARVMNLSVALTQPSQKGERELEGALDFAAMRGIIAVAAAGNQGIIGSSAITRHPWIIPVVACDLQRKPLNISNLGSSIGRHGLCAPGVGITSIGADGKPLTLGGTSIAAPFVTGAIALLWSIFPDATSVEVKSALIQAQRRNTVVPPILDALAAYKAMAKIYSK